MTNQVTAEQLEQEFDISQESVAALASQANGRGFRIAGPEGSSVNVKPNGRPASFGVFAWDGAPSEVPIAYDPGGTNPRIDRYLRKRHCNGCGFNGFITNQCPMCQSGDTIRLYYLRQSDVPFKQAVTGEIACLCSQEGPIPSSPVCPRRGTNGFLSQFQMMQHAMSKHPSEYNIWRDMQRAESTAPGSSSAEIATLMARIQELETKLTAAPQAPAEAPVATLTAPDEEEFPIEPEHNSGGIWEVICGVDGCVETREGTHRPAVISSMRKHRREAHGGR